MNTPLKCFVLVPHLHASLLGKPRVILWINPDCWVAGSVSCIPAVGGVVFPPAVLRKGTYRSGACPNFYRGVAWCGHWWSGWGFKAAGTHTQCCFFLCDAQQLDLTARQDEVTVYQLWPCSDSTPWAQHIWLIKSVCVRERVWWCKEVKFSWAGAVITVWSKEYLQGAFIIRQRI